MKWNFWPRKKEKKAPLPDIAMPTAPKKRAMNIRETALLAAMAKRAQESTYFPPTMPPGVFNSNLAMDAKIKLAIDGWMDSNYGYAINSTFAEGLGFLGYPYLAELTQRAEYRRPAEIIAEEMTRKWIKLQATGDEDKTDKIKKIEAEFERLKIKNLMRKAIEHDGFFGRGQLYIDINDAADKPEELKMPLALTPAKIPVGSLKQLVLVEPMWTYPNAYNAIDPLKEDYFVPKQWFVMGKLVHATRLMFFVSRPLPDLLKPVYAFGGLSLSQMAKPYIDNWLRTRQSVNDIIHAFSVMVLGTDMGDILNAGGADDLLRRAELFSNMRDNRGLMVIDKDKETFQNVAAPLGSLDKLQAQAQEHMSAVTGIPLIKLLGITPSGLNATADGELQVFNESMEARQVAHLLPHLNTCLSLAQLNLFGDIDPDISVTFLPLRQMDAKELSEIRKTEGDSDVAYIQAGVLAPLEVRTRLAADEESPYHGLDVDDVPDPPMGGEGDGGDDDSESTD